MQACSSSVSSSSFGLGRAAVCDCGTPWTFLLPFLLHIAWLKEVATMTGLTVLADFSQGASCTFMATNFLLATFNFQRWLSI